MMKPSTAASLLAAVLLVQFLWGQAAGEWTFLTNSASGVPLYYDRESVRETSDATFTVRTRAVFTEASPVPAGLEDYRYSLGLIELNCGKHTYLIRQVVVFDHAGGTLSAYAPGWGVMPPEPQLEKLFDAVCRPRDKDGQEETRASPPAEKD